MLWFEPVVIQLARSAGQSFPWSIMAQGVAGVIGLLPAIDQPTIKFKIHDVKVTGLMDILMLHFGSFMGEFPILL